MNFKLTLATLAMFGCMGARAQVPTIDIASIAQLIEQIKVAQNQLAQLKTLQATFSGDRGLWNFLNSADEKTLRQYLPADALSILKGGTANASINSEIRQLLLGTNPSGVGTQADRDRQTATAGQSVASTSTYSAADRHAQNIQTILERAGDGTIDSKGLQELQMRMQAENAFVQAEANKLNALTAAKSARDQLALDASKTQFLKFLTKPSSGR